MRFSWPIIGNSASRSITPSFFESILYAHWTTSLQNTQYILINNNFFRDMKEFVNAILLIKSFYDFHFLILYWIFLDEHIAWTTIVDSKAQHLILCLSNLSQNLYWFDSYLVWINERPICVLNCQMLNLLHLFHFWLNLPNWILILTEKQTKLRLFI